MLTKNIIIFAGMLAAISLTACDDGLIYEKTPELSSTGFSVKLSGEIHGVDQWGDNYNVVLAGFEEESDGYATVQKVLPTETDGPIEMTLDNINVKVKTIKLCVTDILRDSIVGFKSIEVDNPEDTIHFNVGKVDVGMYKAIQDNVFNPTCAQCHGGSNTAAAGLYLTSGKSYASLVNQPALHVEGIRVMPGSSAESVLHKVISPDNEAGLGFSHGEMVTSYKLRKLIDDWIDLGAKE